MIHLTDDETFDLLEMMKGEPDINNYLLRKYEEVVRS